MPTDSSAVIEVLTANFGKRVRVTFSDSVTQVVEIGGIDFDGFLHSGHGGGDARDFWTRFEDMKSASSVE